jgi:threonine/homoserine/homoserine lactone efflux protein
VAGAIAGLGVAIPVGAVAVLIIETAARRGLRTGSAAGLGAATADGIYATLAGLFGATIAALIAPLADPLRWVSVVVLVAIGVRGSAGVASWPAAAVGQTGELDPTIGEARSARRTYLAFLGITLLNPMTIAYFAALILGLPAIAGGLAERLAFAAAAFVASAAWQLVLAGAGGLLHRHASPAVIRATSVVGNVVVLGFAALILRDLLAGPT